MKVQKMWQIQNKSEDNAEILLYDNITSNAENPFEGGISAKMLINKIKELGNVKNITLRINSNGGYVFQAQAMYSYLKSHPANITVIIDGIAASAASVVAMAGDKIIMPANATMMIHNPFGGVTGDADTMRDMAEILDKVRDSIANTYIAKTGLDREKINQLMSDETWLTAAEAKKLNFCDEVIGAVNIAAMAVNGGMIFNNGFGFARIDDDLGAKFPKNLVNIHSNKTMQNTQKENKTEMEKFTNITELENAYPELVNEIRNSAINTERERLKNLDKFNARGREEIIAKAKYEEPKDARDIALELLQADTVTAKMEALHTDAEAVNDALTPQKTTPNARADFEADINAVANEISRMRGY